jgi:anti-sigma factor RsiW
MTPDERQELETLLPWHAAGTLDASDAARLDAALAADGELARQFARVREEMAETVHLNEALGAPSPRALDALLAGIDAHPKAARFAAGGRIASLFAGLSPRVLTWAAVAAALVIVLQAGVIATLLPGDRGASYQTASAPSAPAARGFLVLVRFAPDAAMADVARFLETNKASVIDGPKAGGLYRLRIAAEGADDFSRKVAAMQSNKLIAFVGREE